jgi:perosamine synthetase
MAKKNIDCRPFFFPLSMIPAYKNHEEATKAQKRNTVSYSISPYGINLPSGMNMDVEAVKYVCGTLQEMINKIPS